MPSRAFRSYALFCRFPLVKPLSRGPALHHTWSCCRLRCFVGASVSVSVYHSAGAGAVVAGLSTLTPEEVADDPTLCQTQTYLALGQAHLSIREGGFGLTSNNPMKGVAYIGCHILVLGRVVASSARGNLASLLERLLPERPMASALLEELMSVKYISYCIQRDK